MKEIREKIFATIKDASKIAFCADTLDSLDKALAIVAMIKFLQSEGKEVELIISEKLSDEITAVLKKYGIDYSAEAKPLSYVISIDYGSTGLDKVTYDTDEENGLLKFYIIPQSGVFDFENVEYTTEGKSFDLTITLGINSFKDMGEVYDKNEYLFKENTVISLIDEADSLGDIYWKNNEGETFLLSIFRLMKPDISPEVATILVEAFFAVDTFLEGGASDASWGAIGYLATKGANIDASLHKSYFSKSYPNLDLQIKLMQNIKVAKEVGVIWSTASFEDLKFCGVNESNLDLKGRIAFNTSSDFDLAIAAYEIEKDKIKVVIESNDSTRYSAEQIAGVFDGKGNSNHATFTIENMSIKAFEKRFFTVLSDMYDTKVEGQQVVFNTSKAE